MAYNQLPSEFGHLQPLVAQWALACERDRYLKLHASNIEELRAFYSAMLPEMDAVMAFLAEQPAEDMPPDVQTLFHLAMTFAETAHPLDLGWKDVDFPSAFPWEKVEFRTVSLER